MRRTKLAMRSPAVTSSAALSPTSRLTRRLRTRNPRRPSVLPRPLDLRASMGPERRLRRAGNAPKIRPELEQVLGKALSKRPERRFATVGEFAAALGRVTVPHQPGAAVARPESAPVETRSEERRGG